MATPNPPPNSNSAPEITYCSNNPTYHNNKDAAYILPNDEVEHARLEEQARHLLAIMNNEIIHSPIPTSIGPGAKMLDVGCGTGIATDFIGSKFPLAEVYGLDISPVPIHVRANRPSNVTFLTGNFMVDEPGEWYSSVVVQGNENEEETFYPFSKTSSSSSSSSSFDLIFSRFLVCGMTHWPQYISRIHHLLKPGTGYIELQDLDFTWYNKHHQPISHTWKWLQAVKTAALQDGMDWSCASKFPQWLADAGFQDVVVKKYKCPHGSVGLEGGGEENEKWRAWGEFIAKQQAGLVWYFLPRMLASKGYSEEEIEGFRQEAMKCFEVTEEKYWVMSVVVGRKGW